MHARHASIANVIQLRRKNHRRAQTVLPLNLLGFETVMGLKPDTVLVHQADIAIGTRKKPAASSVM